METPLDGAWNRCYEAINTINPDWSVEAAAYIGSKRHLKRLSGYYAACSSAGCARRCDDSRSGECTSRDSHALQKKSRKNCVGRFIQKKSLNSSSRFLGTKKPYPSAHSQRTRRRISEAIRSFCGISTHFELARHARRRVTIVKNDVKNRGGYG